MTTYIVEPGQSIGNAIAKAKGGDNDSLQVSMVYNEALRTIHDLAVQMLGTAEALEVAYTGTIEG